MGCPAARFQLPTHFRSRGNVRYVTDKHRRTDRQRSSLHGRGGIMKSRPCVVTGWLSPVVKVVI